MDQIHQTPAATDLIHIMLPPTATPLEGLLHFATHVTEKISFDVLCKQIGFPITLLAAGN
jgi:hypothetical protein